jgi:hypothetical protein
MSHRNDPRNETVKFMGMTHATQKPYMESILFQPRWRRMKDRPQSHKPRQAKRASTQKKGGPSWTLSQKPHRIDKRIRG